MTRLTELVSVTEKIISERMEELWGPAENNNCLKVFRTENFDS